MPPPARPTPPSAPRPPQHPPLVGLSDWKIGHNTRYFDCAKPSCAWPKNLRLGARRTPFCTLDNVPYNKPYQDGYACWSQAPWQDSADPLLSYGFVASPSSAASCGKCFEFEYTGKGRMRSDDTGSQRLRGKRMIVQATTIGLDVAAGQFDVMLPGGGVGMFDRCTQQWGVNARGVDLGSRFGGFLARCQGCDNDGDCPSVPRTYGRNKWTVYGEARTCVANLCATAFSEPRFAVLKRACDWFVDWYEVADKPEMNYREVECPSAIWRRLGYEI